MGIAQIEPVLVAADGESRANQPGARSQSHRRQLGDPSPRPSLAIGRLPGVARRRPIQAGLAHVVGAGQWFDRSDQRRSRPAFRLGYEIQTLIHAVDKVHVGKARRAEHDRIAPGPTETSVRGQVLRAAVGLHLDDSADTSPYIVQANQMSADQPPRGFDTVRSQSLSRKQRPVRGSTAAERRCVGRCLQIGLSQGKIATMSAGSRNAEPWTRVGMTPSRSAPAMCDWWIRMSWAWRTKSTSPENGDGRL